MGIWCGLHQTNHTAQEFELCLMEASGGHDEWPTENQVIGWNEANDYPNEMEEE